jgi:DNA repair protein RadD
VRAGVRAEHLDGNTPLEERAAILARLASGETEVVTNCMVLTEGFDCPDVGCIVLARPTKQMGLFRQMTGRGLRPADGKTDVVVLDHSGAVRLHGLPEDHVDWTLDTDARAAAPEHVRRQNNHETKLIECTHCSALRMGGMPCPNCGFMPQRPAKYVPIRDGDLALVDAVTRQANAPVYDCATRRRWYAMLLFIQHERPHYSPKWAKANYHEKFKCWPDGWDEPVPILPTPEVRSWVRSRQIAYAKAREKARETQLRSG